MFPFQTLLPLMLCRAPVLPVLPVPARASIGLESVTLPWSCSSAPAATLTSAGPQALARLHVKDARVDDRVAAVGVAPEPAMTTVPLPQRRRLLDAAPSEMMPLRVSVEPAWA